MSGARWGVVWRPDAPMEQRFYIAYVDGHRALWGSRRKATRMPADVAATVANHLKILARAGDLPVEWRAADELSFA